MPRAVARPDILLRPDVVELRVAELEDGRCRSGIEELDLDLIAVELGQVDAAPAFTKRLTCIVVFSYAVCQYQMFTTYSSRMIDVLGFAVTTSVWAGMLFTRSQAITQLGPHTRLAMSVV